MWRRCGFPRGQPAEAEPVSRAGFKGEPPKLSRFPFALPLNPQHGEPRCPALSEFFSAGRAPSAKRPRRCLHQEWRRAIFGEALRRCCRPRPIQRPSPLRRMTHGTLARCQAVGRCRVPLAIACTARRPGEAPRSDRDRRESLGPPPCERGAAASSRSKPASRQSQPRQ